MMDIVLDFFVCVFEVYILYDFLRDILEESMEIDI